MAEALPIILDVDTGIDDALALALAVRSPAVDLRAVTTVAGNVGLPLTTENSRRVLAHLGATDVPVHKGFSRPLARPLHDAQHFHGRSGLGTLELPPATRLLDKPSAPEFLVEAILDAPGTITLVCVGPLTNLAAAIALEPELPGALKRLVIMGGSLGRGNVTPYAEFNIYVDPEAAAQVFAACPLTMVGLDVTERTILSRAAWEGLRETDTLTGRLVYGACEHSFLVRQDEGATARPARGRRCARPVVLHGQAGYSHRGDSHRLVRRAHYAPRAVGRPARCLHRRRRGSLPSGFLRHARPGQGRGLRTHRAEDR